MFEVGHFAAGERRRRPILPSTVCRVSRFSQYEPAAGVYLGSQPQSPTQPQQVHTTTSVGVMYK